MLGNHKLVLDTFCEVYDLIKHWADVTFWDFQEHLPDLIPGAVYVIGRRQFTLNIPIIRELVKNNTIKVILSNPAEGSETLAGQCVQYHVADLVRNKKILLVGGGDMDPIWPCLQYDSFLPKILDYNENIAAASRSEEIFSNTHKPYKFLFLNGRMRSNRKYLIERFHLNGLINQSIWSSLDARDGASRQIKLMHNGKNMMYNVRPIKLLDPYYEFDFYQNRTTIAQQTSSTYVKHDLFDNQWGEIYLRAEPYIDTYFSLVTETVFEYPHSFRTEKIWKPIAMGHPWIAVANAGYYRDMRNLGFKTFSHVIDEGFDSIENNQDRIDRIAQIVEDLCQQDLASFLKECYNVCKYNQQHLAEMRLQVRQEFPERFSQFISNYYT